MLTKLKTKISNIFFRNLVSVNQYLTAPISVLFILWRKNIHPAYRMGILRKLKLARKMFKNTKRIETGTSFKGHMLMALKLLEIPPEVKGDVIECGSWKGGSAANLSLVCEIAGRSLRIYDSFEGLPTRHQNERLGGPYSPGFFRGPLEEVKDNITKHGCIECCQFIKGWYKDTLPGIKGPIVLAFLDVDYEESLDTCIKNIWPELIDTGYLFIDEANVPNYCSLFWSEKYWEKYFQRKPPGLLGAGTGVSLGEYYFGPWNGAFGASELETVAGPAWTRKDYSAFWSFYPDEFEDNI
jgi:O-methyltransferase